jgi:predicted alpha-1,6-mannanase (GH76 family)
MTGLFPHASFDEIFRKIDRKNVLVRLRASRLFLSFLLVFLGAPSAPAFTAEDANTMMDAYNKAFYTQSGSGAHYKETQTDGNTYFWQQAEEIEGMLDAYERTWTPDYKNKVTKLLRGFIDTNGEKWNNNKFNDDCMWACIAFSRAYLDTGISSFKSTAKSNFDMVYARAWDDTLGGGLWWTTENTTKNACINGPGSIAAYLLYLSTGDPDYLTKATDIYNWEKSHLFDPSNGQVYDAMKADGTLSTWSSTYNQGTFVGAADYLGNTHDGALATDFTMNKLGDVSGAYRILPAYGIKKNNDGNDGTFSSDGNNSGFNGIGLRWMAKFMKDNSLENSYLKWLQANANAAWNSRRSADNLSWCNWPKPTPIENYFHSWDCSSSVVALQVVPPDQIDPPDHSSSTDPSAPAEQPAATNQAAPTDQAAPTNSDTK